MGSVIASSLMKGLAIGYVSERFHWMLLGILAGVVITAVLRLLVILRAGMGLFWDIMLTAMLLGLFVGFATQKFGKSVRVKPAVRGVSSR